MGGGGRVVGKSTQGQKGQTAEMPRNNFVAGRHKSLELRFMKIILRGGS